MRVNLSIFRLIANPISGKGKGRKFSEIALKKLNTAGLEGELFLTTGPGHANQLAQDAISTGIRWLIACGGDGTIHEIVNAIGQKQDIILGLIPCGKGNDLASALRIPKNPIQAIEVLLARQTRQTDLGRIGDKFFHTIATCGYDAEVGRRVTEEGSILPGTLAYTQKAITTLPKFEAPEARIEGDFGIFKGKILLTSVGITSSYGGGMKILPDAIVDDGLFDVCIIKPISNLTILRMLITLYWGGHTSHPNVQIHRTRTLSIDTEPPLKLYADGELIGPVPTKIEIINHGITIVVP